MVNYYAEDTEIAIESANTLLPVDRVVALDGRYAGFPPLLGETPGDPPFMSEHEKRNEMLRQAGDPDPTRWLMWLDCDERVIHASPVIDLQLERLSVDVASVAFIEPTQRDAPGVDDWRRPIRDLHRQLPRLIRHLPGLRYEHRHDRLVDGDGNVLVGWQQEMPLRSDPVDVIVVHERWRQPRLRREAKEAFYVGPIRAGESRPIIEAR